jgi:hypothetical protein
MNVGVEFPAKQRGEIFIGDGACDIGDSDGCGGLAAPPIDKLVPAIGAEIGTVGDLGTAVVTTAGGRERHAFP